jgi:hypothetical protein
MGLFCEINLPGAVWSTVPFVPHQSTRCRLVHTGRDATTDHALEIPADGQRIPFQWHDLRQVAEPSTDCNHH